MNNGTTTEILTLPLDLRSGLAAREVERRAVEAYRAGDVGARVTAHYLADFAGRNLHQSLGYGTLNQFAKERMRMAPSTLREYVAIGRRLKELPEIDRLFSEDALCWSHVRLLVRIATEETQLTWGEWARDKTVNELRLQMKRREKGQLPTDPALRRIHTTKLAVQALLNPVQHAVWSLAREVLEERFGESTSDPDIVMWIAHQILREHQDSPLTRRTPQANLDPLNQDPATPFEHRDQETSPALRLEVLARDGQKCVCCGSKRNLSAHHKHWRRYGGKTCLENLATVCEDCHSLVHDRFLILQGEVAGLCFLDSEGRELGERLPPRKFKIRESQDSEDAARAAPSRTRSITFEDLPREVDADWWRRHRHLFTWSERVGGLEFEAGRAAARDDRTPPGAAGPNLDPGPGLDDLVGQGRVREYLRVALDNYGERMKPVLLAGPPGLGKTSLARAIAKELGAQIHLVQAPLVRDPALLVRHLTSLGPGSVLFLDEVHRLPNRAAELLYGALDSGQLDLPVRCGWEQRTLRVCLAPFTLVAATTDEDRLLEAFRSRFVHKQTLEFYDNRALGEILADAVSKQGFVLTSGARDLIAQASRDTPRDGLALVQTVCDQARAWAESEIGTKVVQAALVRTGTTPTGVTAGERAYLRVLAGAGGPLGLSTLAARLGTTRGTVQRIYEPFLLRRGLVRLSGRGRYLTGGSTALATSA